ncbi:DNA mismatch repair protein mutS [Spirochaeta thermophila DSM 6578]|uniref:DNA mismatch repair protein MutS n=1 Tax=Winmispira thermophila (strain ATCC 700085 / DSM 6578 / Z-1203) TaxID=869211 RepID=G0GE72_WINT7|nr:DNA mismatch repair protein MutS [Spirochaeta thermophila]AEJ61425.1 DNA mismatch repair protein mutS [Spirochaeta thermophila DSM 6578]
MQDLQTPMMQQYWEFKKRYREEILFFRLGDFYEMFADDAKEASRILGITLTQRNGIPMCGIPFHAAQNYIARLLRAGKKIAICEQVEVPEKGRGLARREVIEVITPGTVTDEELLEKQKNNFLLAAAPAGKERVSLSCVELSTGEFLAGTAPGSFAEILARELARISPSELILPESAMEEPEIQKVLDAHGEIYVNRFPEWYFDPRTSFERLVRHFRSVNLKAFGLEEDSPELITAGPLLQYLEDTCHTLLPHVRSIHPYREEDALLLDETTIRNLELVKNIQDGGEHFTLYRVLNHTTTPMGARLLRRWILYPLVAPADIEARLEAVEHLYRDQHLLQTLRKLFASMLDIERLATRVALDKAHAKDLLAIAGTIEAYEEAFALLSGIEAFSSFLLPVDLFETLSTLADSLLPALMDNPATSLNEGNIIREGYDPEVDRCRTLRDHSQEILDRYLQEERERSGISSLKLKYNKVIGYFFEVTRANAHLVPSYFIPRQTLVQTQRFTTERLIELESQLAEAEERLVELERKIFMDLRERTKTHLEGLLALGKSVAAIDCLQSLAYAATRYGYTRPVLTTELVLDVKEGRHPVVEAHLPTGSFVPNDLLLDPPRRTLAVITGPNMAGKSTFLRQNALIVLMAQMGSFVPAKEAVIGIADRLFCRVGASDNIARGESTFLVEMNETAYILHHATPRSVIIMDEVGRGTGTIDGLSIAWAVVEYLLERVKARTLFATHFHELTKITHPAVFNLSMAVREDRDGIVFLKRVRAGAAEKSYGIHVARLAGVPEAVVKRARAIEEALSRREEDLTGTEGGPSIPPPDSRDEQPELFSPYELLAEELSHFDVERHTPLEALNAIARWKRLLSKRS